MTFPSACVSFESDNAATGKLSVGDFKWGRLPDLSLLLYQRDDRHLYPGVMLGNGDGTFGTPVLLTTGNPLTVYAVTSDFNHDASSTSP